MLSNTKGYNSRYKALGYREDVQSSQATVCPTLRKVGRCKAHERAVALHQQLAAEKEKELRTKATALYKLQKELLADMDADNTSGSAELASIRELLLADSSAAREAQVIDKLVKELKEEPAYVHWNLDAAVAERMAQLSIRPCRFSHRVEVLQSLKRARTADQQADEKLQKQQREQDRQELLKSAGVGSSSSSIPSAATPPSDAAAPAQAVASRASQRTLQRFDDERHATFSGLTPFQRCVVCLLWQRSVQLPRSVVSQDVRREVEREAEAELCTPGDGNGADALEAYLASPAFEERVSAAETAVVTRTLFRPELGVLDLAALPQTVAFLSQPLQASRAFAARTLTYFGASAKTLFRPPKSARQSTALVPLTEKELDLSAPARATELVEAIEWTLFVYNTERRLRPSSTASPPAQAGELSRETEKLAWARVSCQGGRAVLRSLSLRNSFMTAADGLVASLHKSRGLGQSLLALDLSDNRLHSLRFLFALRAHFAERLLRLSLKNNLITRKPDYQEQVRRSLPRLTSLDGERIRRPPLRFPKCHASSYTALSLAVPATGTGARQPAPSSTAALTPREYDRVMDTVSRLFYIWETRRVPWTELERKAFARESAGRIDTEQYADEEERLEREDALLPMEEDLNEDNFPHRYLHPSMTFSFAAAPGLVFFDPTVVKLNREVELDTDFAGMRLTPQDFKDARVFDVSLKNSSRNLLTGRPAVQRASRGANNCFLAYQYSVYPERVEVDHGLPGAVVSVTKILAANGGSRKGFASKASALSASLSPSFLYLVSLHGVMTWRLPSMHGAQTFTASYDRTMTLAEPMLPAQNYAWERRRSPQLVLCNDQLLLRPLPAVEGGGDSVAGGAQEVSSSLFYSNTAARLARLVVQFGLEACRDGAVLVRCVMERTSSAAAEEIALDALVFGPSSTPSPPPTEGESGVTDAGDEAAITAAVDALLSRHIAAATPRSRPQRGVARRGRTATAAAEEEEEGALHIFSLLSRPTARTADLDATAGSGQPPAVKRSEAWGGTVLHTVPLALLKAVTQLVDARCALRPFTRGARTATAAQPPSAAGV